MLLTAISSYLEVASTTTRYVGREIMPNPNIFVLSTCMCGCRTRLNYYIYLATYALNTRLLHMRMHAYHTRLAIHCTAVRRKKNSLFIKVKVCELNVVRSYT